MKKLTVSEYAAEFKTSVQSVYQRIKRGGLKSIKENGIKYVVIESDTGSKKIKDTLKPEVKSEFKYLVKLIKRLQDQIEDKDKEIKRLTKKLEKCNKTKEDVFLQYIQEIKTTHQLAAPVPDHDDDVIEVKEEKPKKKKVKNSKKKKKK